MKIREFNYMGKLSNKNAPNRDDLSGKRAIYFAI
jgi:hypothetical protein